MAAADEPQRLMDGLDLFVDVIDAAFQQRLVDFTEAALIEGRAGALEGKTYDAPSPKWAATHQSREMVQYGYYTNSNRVFPHVRVAPLPPPLLELVGVLVDRGVFEAGQPPDQCTINAYCPGMWLPPHVDNAKFARPFATVSLLSEQAVVFGDEIRGEGGRWEGELEVPMPCGSALRVGGRAAGPACKHAVLAPTARRISLTFRRLSDAARAEAAQQELAAQERRAHKIAKKAAKKSARHAQRAQRRQQQQQQQQQQQATAEPPSAPHSTQAVAVSAKSTPLPPSMLQAAAGGAEAAVCAGAGAAAGGAAAGGAEAAAGVERPPDAESSSSATPWCEAEHVQRVYDSIAHEWHGTRYKPWPRVAEFIQRQPRGTLFADAGCGNGKNWAACAERGYALGSDFSVELLKICRGLGHEVHSADALALPYRDGAFDALLSIAVLHHISSEARRLRLMAEALRVLRVGGQAIFYAWAFEQDKGKARSGHVFAAQDVLVPWHVRIGAKHASAEERAAAAAGVVERAVASHGEVDVAKGAAVFQRYCHVYVEGELEQLFARMLAGQPAMDARVCEVYYDSGNWAMHVQRLR